MPFSLHGAIVYTDGMGWMRDFAPPGRGGAGAYVQDIDINSDGNLDFYFRSTVTDYRLVMMADNRVLSTLAIAPELGSYTVGLELGAVIGAATTPGVWVERFPGPFLVGSIVYSSGGSTIPYDTERFFAVELHLDGELHYGWIAVKTLFTGNSGYVRGWAFETDPDTEILAGVIPEPSVVLLVFAAGLFLGARRPL